MQKFIFSLLWCFLLQQGQSLNIEVGTYSFFGANPYTEIYFRVAGHSIDWTQKDGIKTASVDMLLFVYHADGTISAYDKFTLTNNVKDSIVDFIGVKRFRLKEGTYTIKLEAADTKKKENKLEMEQKLQIGGPGKQVILSDILLLSRLTKDTSANSMVKNGFYMEPLPYQFSSASQKQLDFYIEYYPYADSTFKEYFLQYNIMEGFASDINTKVLMSKYKKLDTAPVEALLLSFPASGMRSGNYHISVNVINKEKQVLFNRKIDLVKSNPEADIAYLESYNETLTNSFVQQITAEEMDYVLKAHLPITEQHQMYTLGELIRGNRIKSQRQFIFQYWKSKAPSNPEEAYKKYMEVARAVDKKFYSNVGYGFQTDRGHIFLKYGKPNNVIAVDTELDAPPYEIWYYAYMPLSRQTNVRFLFYNPSLAHNDYKLLHSTCLGERVYPAWETELYKSVPGSRIGNSVDATQVTENFNRNARRYFNEY